MKAHERKAIDRALIYRLEHHWSRQVYTESEARQERHALARSAVSLAQIRAGRAYDLATRTQALGYALELLATVKSKGLL